MVNNDITTTTTAGEREQEQEQEQSSFLWDTLEAVGRQSTILKSILDHLAFEVESDESSLPSSRHSSCSTSFYRGEVAENKLTTATTETNYASSNDYMKTATVAALWANKQPSVQTAPSSISFVRRESSTSSTTSSAHASINTPPRPRQEEQEKSGYSINKTQQPPSSTPPTHKPVFPAWTKLMEGYLHRWIRGFVVTLGTYAARHPWRVLWSIGFLSFALAGVGLCTNFTIVFDHEQIFTPINSPPAKQGQWIVEESGFLNTADFLLVLHAPNGENILHVEAIRRLFEAIETLQNVDGYDDLCAHANYIDDTTNQHTCEMWSVTKYWDHNKTAFEEQELTENDLVQIVSQPSFPSGMPVAHDLILGAFQRSSRLQPELHQSQAVIELYTNPHNGNVSTFQQVDSPITYVPLFFVSIGMPAVDDETDAFQERALAQLQQLQQSWQEESMEMNPYQLELEFFCQYAYLLEYERALNRDLPLIPVIFLVMLGFTMFVFHCYGKRKQQQTDHPDHHSCWQSRASLGISSVVTIGMSLMSGFGMLFCLGVPFTNITQMVPFIILGVGLDDTFIITGAYFRRLREYHAQHDAQHRAEAVTSSISSPDVTKKGLGKANGNPNELYAVNMTHNNATTLSQQQQKRQEEEDRVVQRVHDTLQEVGLSISLTTLTTTFAFILGCISTIPGIRWLCLYASATIVFDSLYQISFFIALLVLDERRIAGTLFVNRETGEHAKWFQCILQYCCCGLCRRRCCCCCCCGGNKNDANYDHHHQQLALGSPTTTVGSTLELFVEYPAVSEEEETTMTQEEEEEFFMDRFMRWYSKQLLRPVVKVLVLVIFLLFFALNVWSTTQLEQQFNIEDYVPKDSYVQPFIRSLREHSTVVVAMAAYFQGVDQSDPEIQQQMRIFVDDLTNLDQVGEPPRFCWVRDMMEILESESAQEHFATSSTYQGISESKRNQMALLADTLKEGNFTFEEKMNFMLNMPGIREVYGDDIVLDEDGKVTASRCYIFIRNLDLLDIKDQINMLNDQREVTLNQPINQLSEFQDVPAFFSFDDLFYYWQLYTVAVYELVFTTIWGVVAVCVVGFLIIPHWTAALFVGPLIVMLYFNLLGTMQVCGIYINAVTYVTVVISIGLLVDFLMHILLRYYETKGATREEKVKETLETIGASMMLGGFTTWLGVLPMAFSTTKIFMTLFVAFLAMVSWGLLVGLVFLPVILSICGPLVSTRTDGASTEIEASVDTKAKEVGAVHEDPTMSMSHSTDNFCECPEQSPQVAALSNSRTLSNAQNVSPGHCKSLAVGELSDRHALFDEASYFSDDDTFVSCFAAK